MLTFEEKEINFFNLLQYSAKEHNAQFFIDTSEGHDLETPDLYCEDMSGWLIPLDKAEEFFADVQMGDENSLDKWQQFFVFARWLESDEGIKIEFDSR